MITTKATRKISHTKGGGWKERMEGKNGREGEMLPCPPQHFDSLFTSTFTVSTQKKKPCN
jgi:hypothetical protein